MTKPNRKRLGWSVAGLLVIAIAIAAFTAAPMQGVQTDGSVIPTARVAQGDVPVVVHATGDLRPLRAQALVAPAVGSPMQILNIAATGTPVKEGEVIVEFDQSEQQERLETAASELAQAEQEIAKMRADAVVEVAQDDVTLLTARFDVRRGELDIQGAQLRSAIDQQKLLLTLEEARGRLAQLEGDLQSRTASNRASLAVLEEKRNKARLQMDNAQRNIENMTLRAPFDGLVAVKPNDMNNAAWAGVVVPEFRAGDTVFSGRPVAEVLHQSGLELVAKVNEYDRAHLNAGQNAEVTIHAVQGKSLPATIKAVAGASRREVWAWNDPTRTFDVSFDVTGSNLATLRPGLTTHVRITGAPIKAALYLPRQALFEHDGKPVVFVRQGRSFEPREVKVSHRTETHIVVTDLPVGTEVALRNPLADEKKGAGSAGPVQAGAGR
ncbi:MAG: HlyD family efflux transporter periplasmic adaptor subunit [Vicinamibacterales bacterium]